MMVTSVPGASIITVLTATIPAGESVSNKVSLGATTLTGVGAPDSLTTDTQFWFEEELQGQWYTIKEPQDNTDPFFVTLKAGTLSSNPLLPGLFGSMDSLRIRVATPQAQERRFLLKVRRFR